MCRLCCRWEGVGTRSDGDGRPPTADHCARLCYSINTLVVELGGRKLRLPFTLNNSLTVFFSQPAARGWEGGCNGGPGHTQVACARSALGGTLLMVAEPEGAARYYDRPRP